MPAMFGAELVETMRSLDELVLCLITQSSGSPGMMFGCCLGILLAAAAESERTGTAAPLHSFLSHCVKWARERKLADGRKVGDVAAELSAAARGENN